MMKAILLARVSDKKQDSNEAQVFRISDYIRYKNLEVWKTYEIEESSTRGDRTKFQEIITQIRKSKECIALVVDTVDRLQRSFRESVLLDELRKEGRLEIHFYRENLVIHKNSNSADLLRWDMAVMFARSYVLQLSDNVKRKFDQMRRNGIWTGRAPLGYKNIGDERNRNIVIDNDTAHLVKRLFELYATGSYSCKQLCRKMTALGLRGQHGKELVQSTIYLMLNNPFYYGVMVCVGKKYPHRYQPLITWQLFNNCQAVMHGWKKKPFQYRAKPFMFRGLFRCGKCGCSMSPEIKKGKYVYYSCTNARKAVCNTKTYVKEETLLAPIVKILKAYETLHPVLAKEILDGLKEVDTKNTLYYQHTLVGLEQESKSISIKLERLTDILIEGTISSLVYEAKRDELNVRLSEINDRIEVYSRTTLDDFYVTAAHVLGVAYKAFSLFDGSEPELKRPILDLILQNSVVNGKKPEFSLRSPFNTIYDLALDPLGRGPRDTFRTLDWSEIKKKIARYEQKIQSDAED